MPILEFLGLSVLDLGPMYATDRQTSDAHHRLMPPTGGIITSDWSISNVHYNIHVLNAVLSHCLCFVALIRNLSRELGDVDWDYIYRGR